MYKFNSQDILEYIHTDGVLMTNLKNENIPDLNILNKICDILPKGKIVTISEGWCPDCKRDIPKIGKIYEIKKIPTFIVFDQNENELGRIIEKKKSNSLEENILEIISNN